MEASRITTAARKALIAADSDYFSWTAQQQETFRATMGEAPRNRADRVLLKELLGIQCAANNAGKVWSELPLSKLNELNWAKLLTSGVGENFIMLNEIMAKNTSLLDFDTLYDYDFDDHLFQESANKKQITHYQSRDYYALRFSRWARLIVDGQFYYATLYSSASYLIEQLEGKGSDMIQTLIPHEYVEGKNHGKTEKGGFLWDTQIDAAGLERQLDELKSRWYQYTQERWLELSKQFSQIHPAVYVEDKSENNELHRNFIFNNESALKQIRWRHFLADCEATKADFAAISELEQQELMHTKTWLQTTHQDIMQNFDPNVIKLKQKRKIVIAPGAFDGLAEWSIDD